MFHPLGPTFFELARQALSSTERGYDLLAPKFDYTPFRTPSAVLEAVAGYIAARGEVEAAVDVCCGTGAAMEVLRPLCRRRIVGIDMSRGMLEVARRRVAAAPGSAEIDLVRGNALEMPLDEQFDIATCFGALGHILPADQPSFTRQVAATLKPGGRFYFVTGYMPPLYSSQYWLSRGFNAAMHVRNFLISPPFVMFYLTFLLPDAQTMLEESGFDVQIVDGIFPQRYRSLRLVVGTKGSVT